MATDRAAFEVQMIDAYGPHINLARTPDGYAHSVAHRTLPRQYASIQMLWEAWREARAQPTRPAAVEPPELSPDFTDTARAALLWVLWHHQGGSSPVGQPIRWQGHGPARCLLCAGRCERGI